MLTEKKKVLVRMPPELYNSAKQYAEEKGASVNSVIVASLAFHMKLHELELAQSKVGKR